MKILRLIAQSKKAFTLVEVLVAMLVLAIGLLGLAGITVVVLRSNVLSQQISEATTISSDLVERIKMLPYSDLDPSSGNPKNCGIGNGITFTAGSCPILEDSGIDGLGNTIFYPSSYTDVDCGISGILPPFATENTFDIISANLVAEVPTSTSNFCTNFTNLEWGKYVRYYRIYDPDGSDSEREILVVVLWKDRFNRWRHVRLVTSRTP